MSSNQQANVTAPQLKASAMDMQTIEIMTIGKMGYMG
jgi:hypothetical protein